MFEVVLVSEEAAFEVRQTKFEENRVVFALEDRVADVADQVLKERAHHYIHYLANLQVDVFLQGGRLMVLLEIHAARYVLFSRSFIQVSKGLLRVIL